MVSRSVSKIIDVGLLGCGPKDWTVGIREGIVSPNQEEQWHPAELDLRERPQLNLPKFFRNIVETDNFPEEVAVDELDLTDMLENNLVLSGKWLIAGKDSVEGYFLCAAIEDEDLPWNPKETDS